MDCKAKALDVDADGIDGEVRSNERTLSRRGFAKAALLAGIGMAGSAAFGGCASAPESGSASGKVDQSAAIDFAKLEAGSLRVGAGHAAIKLDAYCPIDEGNTQAGQAKGTPDFVHSEGYYTNVREGHDLRFSMVLLEFNDEK